MTNEYWITDLRLARELLQKNQGEISSIDTEWLLDVIDDANHEERKKLREGIDVGPRSLWYDYDEQCWIN